MNIPLNQIHELAANYSDRQGLRIVPMAVMILLQSIPRPLRLPQELFAAMVPLTLLIGIGGYVLIGRYYTRRFGRVDELPYAGFPVAGQIVLVAAGFFITIAVDVLKRPPLFLSGLLLAAWLIATSWASRHIRGYYSAAGIVLGLVSLLPLAGVPQSRVAGMYGMVFGAALLVAGIRDHLQFVGLFPSASGSEIDGSELND